ncbi:MAG: dienelactone hydrolase family protein [Acidobacteriota bacterium]
MIRGSLSVQHSVDYALVIPETPGPWPVLLALHGFGQGADSFARILDPLARQGILVAVPQAPNQFYVNMKSGQVGFTWLTRYQRDRSMADLVHYLERFWELVRTECQADEGRLFILGFSQGVSIAYRLWLYGKLPLQGLFACGSDLPPDVEERLDSKPSIPVRLIHGRNDMLIPTQKPLHALEALRGADFDVEYKEFEAAHELTPEILDYVSRHIHP